MTGVRPLTCPNRPIRRCATAYDSATIDHPEELAREGQGELRVRDQVPPGEAARLEQQPIAPLEARALHPARRAALRAGGELEDGPDPEQQRSVEQLARGLHPLFL